VNYRTGETTILDEFLVMAMVPSTEENLDPKLPIGLRLRSFA